MSVQPKKCKCCGTKVNPLLQYCPECESYLEDEPEEDIHDYDDEDEITHALNPTL